MPSGMTNKLTTTNDRKWLGHDYELLEWLICSIENREVQTSYVDFVNRGNDRPYPSYVHIRKSRDALLQGIFYIRFPICVSHNP